MDHNEAPPVNDGLDKVLYAGLAIAALALLFVVLSSRSPDPAGPPAPRSSHVQTPKPSPTRSALTPVPTPTPAPSVQGPDVPEELLSVDTAGAQSELQALNRVAVNDPAQGVEVMLAQRRLLAGCERLLEILTPRQESLLIRSLWGEYWTTTGRKTAKDRVDHLIATSDQWLAKDVQRFWDERAQSLKAAEEAMTQVRRGVAETIDQALAKTVRTRISKRPPQAPSELTRFLGTLATVQLESHNPLDAVLAWRVWELCREAGTPKDLWARITTDETDLFPRLLTLLRRSDPQAAEKAEEQDRRNRERVTLSLCVRELTKSRTGYDRTKSDYTVALGEAALATLFSRKGSEETFHPLLGRALRRQLRDSLRPQLSQRSTLWLAGLRQAIKERPQGALARWWGHYLKASEAPTAEHELLAEFPSFLTGCGKAYELLNPLLTNAPLLRAALGRSRRALERHPLTSLLKRTTSSPALALPALATPADQTTPMEQVAEALYAEFIAAGAWELTRATSNYKKRREKFRQALKQYPRLTDLVWKLSASSTARGVDTRAHALWLLLRRLREAYELSRSVTRASYRYQGFVLRPLRESVRCSNANPAWPTLLVDFEVLVQGATPNRAAATGLVVGGEVSANFSPPRESASDAAAGSWLIVRDLSPVHAKGDEGQRRELFLRRAFALSGVAPPGFLRRTPTAFVVGNQPGTVGVTWTWPFLAAQPLVVELNLTPQADGPWGIAGKVGEASVSGAPRFIGELQRRLRKQVAEHREKVKKLAEPFLDRLASDVLVKPGTLHPAGGLRVELQIADARLGGNIDPAGQLHLQDGLLPLSLAARLRRDVWPAHSARGFVSRARLRGGVLEVRAGLWADVRERARGQVAAVGSARLVLPWASVTQTADATLARVQSVSLTTPSGDAFVLVPQGATPRGRIALRCVLPAGNLPLVDVTLDLQGRPTLEAKPNTFRTQLVAAALQTRLAKEWPALAGFLAPVRVSGLKLVKGVRPAFSLATGLRARATLGAEEISVRCNRTLRLARQLSEQHRARLLEKVNRLHAEQRDRLQSWIRESHQVSLGRLTLLLPADPKREIDAAGTASFAGTAQLRLSEQRNLDVEIRGLRFDLGDALSLKKPRLPRLTDLRNLELRVIEPHKLLSALGAPLAALELHDLALRGGSWSLRARLNLPRVSSDLQLTLDARWRSGFRGSLLRALSKSLEGLQLAEASGSMRFTVRGVDVDRGRFDLLWELSRPVPCAVLVKGLEPRLSQGKVAWGSPSVELRSHDLLAALTRRVQHIERRALDAAPLALKELKVGLQLSPFDLRLTGKCHFTGPKDTPLAGEHALPFQLSRSGLKLESDALVAVARKALTKSVHDWLEEALRGIAADQLENLQVVRSRLSRLPLPWKLPLQARVLNVTRFDIHRFRSEADGSLEIDFGSDPARYGLEFDLEVLVQGGHRLLITGRPLRGGASSESVVKDSVPGAFRLDSKGLRVTEHVHYAFLHADSPEPLDPGAFLASLAPGARALEPLGLRATFDLQGSLVDGPAGSLNCTFRLDLGALEERLGLPRKSEEVSLARLALSSTGSPELNLDLTAVEQWLESKLAKARVRCGALELALTSASIDRVGVRLSAAVKAAFGQTTIGGRLEGLSIGRGGLDLSSAKLDLSGLEDFVRERILAGVGLGRSPLKLREVHASTREVSFIAEVSFELLGEPITVATPRVHLSLHEGQLRVRAEGGADALEQIYAPLAQRLVAKVNDRVAQLRPLEVGLIRLQLDGLRLGSDRRLSCAGKLAVEGWLKPTPWTVALDDKGRVTLDSEALLQAALAKLEAAARQRLGSSDEWRLLRAGDVELSLQLKELKLRSVRFALLARGRVRVRQGEKVLLDLAFQGDEVADFALDLKTGRFRFDLRREVFEKLAKAAADGALQALAERAPKEIQVPFLGKRVRLKNVRWSAERSMFLGDLWVVVASGSLEEAEPSAENAVCVREIGATITDGGSPRVSFDHARGENLHLLASMLFKRVGLDGFVSVTRFDLSRGKFVLSARFTIPDLLEGEVQDLEVALPVKPKQIAITVVNAALATKSKETIEFGDEQSLTLERVLVEDKQGLQVRCDLSLQLLESPIPVQVPGSVLVSGAGVSFDFSSAADVIKKSLGALAGKVAAELANSLVDSPVKLKPVEVIWSGDLPVGFRAGGSIRLGFVGPGVELGFDELTVTSKKLIPPCVWSLTLPLSFAIGPIEIFDPGGEYNTKTKDLSLLAKVGIVKSEATRYLIYFQSRLTLPLKKFNRITMRGDLIVFNFLPLGVVEGIVDFKALSVNVEFYTNPMFKDVFELKGHMSLLCREARFESKLRMSVLRCEIARGEVLLDFKQGIIVLAGKIDLFVLTVEASFRIDKGWRNPRLDAKASVQIGDLSLVSLELSVNARRVRIKASVLFVSVTVTFPFPWAIDLGYIGERLLALLNPLEWVKALFSLFSGNFDISFGPAGGGGGDGGDDGDGDDGDDGGGSQGGGSQGGGSQGEFDDGDSTGVQTGGSQPPSPSGGQAGIDGGETTPTRTPTSPNQTPGDPNPAPPAPQPAPPETPTVHTPQPQPKPAPLSPPGARRSGGDSWGTVRGARQRPYVYRWVDRKDSTGVLRPHFVQKFNQDGRIREHFALPHLSAADRDELSRYVGGDVPAVTLRPLLWGGRADLIVRRETAVGERLGRGVLSVETLGGAVLDKDRFVTKVRGTFLRVPAGVSMMARDKNGKAIPGSLPYDLWRLRSLQWQILTRVLKKDNKGLMVTWADDKRRKGASQWSIRPRPSLSTKGLFRYHLSPQRQLVAVTLEDQDLVKRYLENERSCTYPFWVRSRHGSWSAPFAKDLPEPAKKILLDGNKVRTHPAFYEALAYLRAKPLVKVGERPWTALMLTARRSRPVLWVIRERTKSPDTAVDRVPYLCPPDLLPLVSEPSVPEGIEFEQSQSQPADSKAAPTLIVRLQGAAAKQFREGSTTAPPPFPLWLVAPHTHYRQRSQTALFALEEKDADRFRGLLDAEALMAHPAFLEGLTRQHARSSRPLEPIHFQEEEARWSAAFIQTTSAKTERLLLVEETPDGVEAESFHLPADLTRSLRLDPGRTTFHRTPGEKVLYVGLREVARSEDRYPLWRLEDARGFAPFGWPLTRTFRRDTLLDAKVLATRPALIKALARFARGARRGLRPVSVPSSVAGPWTLHFLWTDPAGALRLVRLEEQGSGAPVLLDVPCPGDLAKALEQAADEEPPRATLARCDFPSGAGLVCRVEGAATRRFPLWLLPRDTPGIAPFALARPDGRTKLADAHFASPALLQSEPLAQHPTLALSLLDHGRKTPLWPLHASSAGTEWSVLLAQAAPTRAGRKSLRLVRLGDARPDFVVPAGEDMAELRAHLEGGGPPEEVALDTSDTCGTITLPATTKLIGRAAHPLWVFSRDGARTSPGRLVLAATAPLSHEKVNPLEPDNLLQHPELALSLRAFARPRDGALLPSLTHFEVREDGWFLVAHVPNTSAPEIGLYRPARQRRWRELPLEEEVNLEPFLASLKKRPAMRSAFFDDLVDLHEDDTLLMAGPAGKDKSPRGYALGPTQHGTPRRYVVVFQQAQTGLRRGRGTLLTLRTKLKGREVPDDFKDVDLARKESVLRIIRLVLDNRSSGSPEGWSATPTDLFKFGP